MMVIGKIKKKRNCTLFAPRIKQKRGVVVMMESSLMLGSCQTSFPFHVSCCKWIWMAYISDPAWKRRARVFLGPNKGQFCSSPIFGSGQEVTRGKKSKTEQVKAEIFLLLFFSVLWIRTSQSWQPRVPWLVFVALSSVKPVWSFVLELLCFIFWPIL